MSAKSTRSRTKSCRAPLSGREVASLARRFKAMGDPTRLAMLLALRDCAESLCACEIESGFDLSQPTISHHLRVLKEAGLVESERHASWMYYRISASGLAEVESFVHGLSDAAARS